MTKNLVIKITLIIVLVLAGIFLLFAGVVSTIYIAGKTRMWILTRNMTGGTSLVYEIDTIGLSEEEKKDLSRKMVAVLRRRIDPRGKLPIIWRPLGDTRFEIQISHAAGPSAPQDIQRTLKGAGILEFRVLPTQGHPEVDMDAADRCVKSLQEKGPKYATDNEYVWCEIEDIHEWMISDLLEGRPRLNVFDAEQRPAITSQFGEKYYVLASNKPDEAMLYRPGKAGWRLKKVKPTTDNMGRRSIGFTLDEQGGKLFAEITGKNIGRPLCILLDGIAMSAPNVQSRIHRQGIITGSFTQTQVEDIVNKLNAGSLPARLIERSISIETIGPSTASGKHDKSEKNEKELIER